MTKNVTLKGVKQENPAQSKRFIEAAQEHEVDETGAALDKAMERLSSGNKKPEPSRQ